MQSRYINPVTADSLVIGRRYWSDRLWRALIYKGYYLIYNNKGYFYGRYCFEDFGDRIFYFTTGQVEKLKLE